MGLLLDGIVSAGAEFSGCRKYRYRLWRHWSLTPTSRCLFIMLNPSTADTLSNDPTVERCQRRARAMGFDAVDIVNLFAFRATDPTEMMATDNPIGPDNDEAIYTNLSWADFVICGWGAHGSHVERSKWFWMTAGHYLHRAGGVVHHLGLTAAGEPRHPLYISYDTKPTPMDLRPQSQLGWGGY